MVRSHFRPANDLPIMHAGGANGHYDGAGRTVRILIILFRHLRRYELPKVF